MPEFLPFVRRWFEQTFTEATRPQREGWEAIASGKDTLIVAPTGSGKTLAAFLWALDHLNRLGLEGKLEDRVYVVYVSPLRALNNDIEKNLREPLAGLRAAAEADGLDPPEIRVAVRTGDTLAAARQAMTRRPPHVLITTPESLYILLTSAGFRPALAQARFVIVDEVHALMGSKRGAHLALSLERLQALVAEREPGARPQRIGCSATVSPIEDALGFLTGATGRDPVVVDAGFSRDLDVQVVSPVDDFLTATSDTVWDAALQQIAELVAAHRTTLVFAQSRRAAERLARDLNDRITDGPGEGAFPGLGKIVAYLREHDPAHLAYINLYPTYASEEQLGVSADAAARAKAGSPVDSGDSDADAGTVRRYREHLKDYIETVKPDLLSYDHYHFLKESDGREKDGKEYFLNLGLMRAAALGAQRPFLNIIQADTISKNWRLPTAAEERWLAFTTMAYGGRGISYFTYWGPKEYNGLYIDGQKQPLMDDVAKLNHEIAKFGPALLELRSVGVYHTAPVPFGAEAVPADSPVQILGDGEFVLGLFGRDERPSAFMVVNRDYKHAVETTIKISLPGRKLQELDRQTGNWTRVKGLSGARSVKVKLAAGDGRLFRVVP